MAWQHVCHTHTHAHTHTHTHTHVTDEMWRRLECDDCEGAFVVLSAGHTGARRATRHGQQSLGARRRVDENLLWDVSHDADGTQSRGRSVQHETRRQAWYWHTGQTHTHTRGQTNIDTRCQTHIVRHTCNTSVLQVNECCSKFNWCAQFNTAIVDIRLCPSQSSSCAPW